MYIDAILSNELQLRPTPASLLGDHRRSDFALLYAMLSQDAVDWPSAGKIAVEPGLQGRMLPESGPNTPLAAQHHDWPIAANDHYASKDMTQWRLANCLQPRPLALKDNAKQIDSAVLANLEPNVAKRVLGNTVLNNEPDALHAVVTMLAFADEQDWPNLTEHERQLLAAG